MGRHTGINGVVKFGGNFVSGVTSFDVDDKVSTVNQAAMGEVWDNPKASSHNWGGSVSAFIDWDDNAQGVRAGDEVVVELYTEGDAIGMTMLSGSSIIETVKYSAARTDGTTVSLSLLGQGDLATAVVS